MSAAANRTTAAATAEPAPATWLVRVGGEYAQAGGDDNWRRVVTLITEQGYVHYQLRYRVQSPDVGFSEPSGHHHVTLAQFREMSAPVDQSALPAVEAWLAGLVDNGIGSTVVELGDVLRQAEALLAEIRAGKHGGGQ